MCVCRGESSPGVQDAIDLESVRHAEERDAALVAGVVVVDVHAEGLAERANLARRRLEAQQL